MRVRSTCCSARWIATPPTPWRPPSPPDACPAHRLHFTAGRSPSGRAARAGAQGAIPRRRPDGARHPRQTPSPCCTTSRRRKSSSQALAADGGSAWAWSRSGWINVYKGEPEAAIERFKIALDLAPHDSLAFNSLIGSAARISMPAAIARPRMAGARAHRHSLGGLVHRTSVPAYALAGAAPEARRSLATLREHYPDLTIAEVQQGLPPLPESYRDRMFGGLRGVGLPP